MTYNVFGGTLNLAQFSMTAVSHCMGVKQPAAADYIVASPTHASTHQIATCNNYINITA